VKLACIVRAWNEGSVADVNDLWSEIGLWSVTEHGMSIFACAVLALRPLLQNAAKMLSTASGSSRRSSKGSKSTDTRDSKSINDTSQSYQLLLQNRRSPSFGVVNHASTSGGFHGAPNCIVEAKTVSVETHSMV
jgi:hypothetical protein